MFRYIKSDELFEIGGRHFVSEDFMRIHSAFMPKWTKGSFGSHDPAEWLFIVFKGDDAIITPDGNNKFTDGDQLYGINIDYFFQAYTDIKLLGIHLPGPYTAKRFILQSSKIIRFSESELLGVNNKIFVDEIYGKVCVRKFKNEIYRSSVKDMEELIILCVDGSCQFTLSNGKFSICKGEQVYLKNELYELSFGDETVLEFIQAPTEKYIDMLMNKESDNAFTSN